MGLPTKNSGGTITHLHTWWQDDSSFNFPWCCLLPGQIMMQSLDVALAVTKGEGSKLELPKEI